MTILRATVKGTVVYRRAFLEVNNVSLKEYSAITRAVKPKGKTKWANYTEQLTAYREALIAAGYEKEVERADRQYLKVRCGLASKKEWENSWQELYANDDIPKDAL